MGELLVAWSARLAIACWAGRLLVDAAPLAESRREPLALRLWTAGCALLLLHVACAFQFVHGWSHAAAWEHTARQTERLTGWNWGGGLLANYALAAFWTADVAHWWRRGARFPSRSARVWNWFFQAFLAFMVVNATVVFGPWFWKPAAVAFTIFWALLSRRRHFSKVSSNS